MNEHFADDRSDQSLGMFVKYWQAGQVKTRLGKSIGAQSSANLYREFVRCLSSRLADEGDSRVLAYWPGQRRREIQALVGSQWKLETQTGRDLGERMKSFFRRRFELGTSRALLIGSDSPTIPMRTFGEAFDALRSHDLVLGPARDGGYYLVGMSADHVGIFSEINWSTSSVCEQTQGKIRQLGLRCYLLSEYFDVDAWCDLGLLRMELNRLSSTESGDKSIKQLADLLHTVLAVPPMNESSTTPFAATLATRPRNDDL
jgi:rSAM/selenodomain-associated transferase 1